MFEKPIELKKEIPTDEMWKKGDFKMIAEYLKKKFGQIENYSARAGISDYQFEINDTANALGLSEFFEKNENLQKIITETGNPNHNLVEHLKRQIVLDKYIPFVASLSKTKAIQEDYYIEPKTGNDYKFTPMQIKQLLRIALCTAKGTGYKMLGIDIDKEKIVGMTVPAKEFISVLESNKHIDILEKTENELRGKELVEFIKSTMENEKESLENRYKKIKT